MARTLQEIADKIAWEGGIGDALMYFGREVDSDTLHFNYLWREAYDACMALEEYLPEASEEE